jgi:hypothetical protein
VDGLDGYEAADSFLDTLSSEDLQRTIVKDQPVVYTAGSLMQRVIYHYWYHTGGILIRQMLGPARVRWNIDRSAIPAALMALGLIDHAQEQAEYQPRDGVLRFIDHIALVTTPVRKGYTWISRGHFSPTAAGIGDHGPGHQRAPAEQCIALAAFRRAD